MDKTVRPVVAESRSQPPESVAVDNWAPGAARMITGVNGGRGALTYGNVKRLRSGGDDKSAISTGHATGARY